MVKLKTDKEFELFDKRNKSIGSHIIRLVVNEITATENEVVAKGYYYYETLNENEQVVINMLDGFATKISWDQVEQAETQLPAFDAQHLREAFLQRIIEFTFIQQQIEDGENFGTSYTDWERDEEYDELLRQQGNEKN